MELEYDVAKNEKNIRERGLSFELAHEFDFRTATTRAVERNGETRYVSIGWLQGQLHLLVCKPSIGKLRIISLRRASRREVREYGAGG